MRHINDQIKPYSFNMLNRETPPLTLVVLHGADRLTYLQGQITQDIRSLPTDQATPAALLTPQGRVIATLWLLPTAEQIALAMPTSLIQRVHAHLMRSILRAKVTLEKATLERTHADMIAHTLGEPTLADILLNGPVDTWTHALISAGRAEITEATCESWIPQMLNLDLVGAISFSKGCYTGQEIVARTQHLGRIKRRLACFSGHAAAVPAPHSALLLGPDKVGEVVNAVRHHQALSLLAVVQVDSLQQPLTLEDGTALTPHTLPYAVTT